MTGRVVNTIPSRDVVLRRVVDHVTAAAPRDSAAELTARLRPIYPRIAVFERQLSGEQSSLYVYRDGRYVPEREDPWWAEPDAPRVDVSLETGRVTSVSAAAASLFNAEPGDLVGHHYTDFVLPEAQPAARAMFEAVEERHEVRSEALVKRPDGTTVPIEFRAVAVDDGIEVSYRPLDQSS